MVVIFHRTELVLDCPAGSDRQRAEEANHGCNARTDHCNYCELHGLSPGCQPRIKRAVTSPNRDRALGDRPCCASATHRRVVTPTLGPGQAISGLIGALALAYLAPAAAGS